MPDAKGAIGPGAKAIAAARAQAEAVHVNFEAHVMTGHPVPAICDLKCADRFDLLVIGDLGRSEFYKWLFGSTAILNGLAEEAHFLVFLDWSF
jgi:nucleotide-binding universal stress UspA family protein